MPTTKKNTNNNKTTTPTKPTGRPRKVINKETFEALCSIQCTQSEICSVLKVCEDTIFDWCKREYGAPYSDVYKKYSENGKASLRRIQFALAKKNPAMAIFLGKQYLGQRDVIEQDNSAKIEVVTGVPEDD